MSVSAPVFCRHFAEIALDYELLLSDVWGVIHNGIAANSSACEALTSFRKQGGSVVLITNAPRPGAVVVRTMLDRLSRELTHVEPAGDPEWAQSHFVSGVKHLPLSYSMR